MQFLLLPFTPRFIIYTMSLVASVTLAALAWTRPELLPYLSVFLAAFVGLALLGTSDLLQTKHAVLRNYPISAHIRFLLEKIRPEMRQVHRMCGFAKRGTWPLHRTLVRHAGRNRE